ncbi:hypothetical protein HY251_02980 [bacterium]|nr:hypothetical protein [bacterium]
MWTERAGPSRALVLASACALALVLAPARAGADEPAATKPHADPAKAIDFSKHPRELECWDKTRIAVTRSVDARGALTIKVSGAAYYPDGTTYVVAVRHAKQEAYFGKVTARVSAHAFQATVGSFSQSVPRGELVVDAWFVYESQTDAVKKVLDEGDGVLVKGSYFHCPNGGCKYDRKNFTKAVVDHGGAAGQAADEAAEKDAVALARTTLIDARKAARRVLDGVERGEKSPREGKERLDRLERDTKDALETFARWREKRVFLLFPGDASNVSALADAIVLEARLRAASVGLEIPSLDAKAAGEQLAAAQGKVGDLSDTLKGFLDEAGSLDKAWNEIKARREAAAAAAKVVALSGK